MAVKKGTRDRYDYMLIGKIINYHLANPLLFHYEIAELFEVSQSYVTITLYNHFQSIRALEAITKEETQRKAA